MGMHFMPSETRHASSRVTYVLLDFRILTTTVWFRTIGVGGTVSCAVTFQYQLWSDMIEIAEFSVLIQVTRSTATQSSISVWARARLDDNYRNEGEGQRARVGRSGQWRSINHAAADTTKVRARCSIFDAAENAASRADRIISGSSRCNRSITIAEGGSMHFDEPQFDGWWTREFASDSSLLCRPQLLFMESSECRPQATSHFSQTSNGTFWGTGGGGGFLKQVIGWSTTQSKEQAELNY